DRSEILWEGLRKARARREIGKHNGLHPSRLWIEGRRCPSSVRQSGAPLRGPIDRPTSRIRFRIQLWPGSASLRTCQLSRSVSDGRRIGGSSRRRPSIGANISASRYGTVPISLVPWSWNRSDEKLDAISAGDWPSPP